MKVKIVEYGFSDEYGKYYVTYEVSEASAETLTMLQEKLEDPIKIACKDLFITTYFEKEYYPFSSLESQKNTGDFVAREEIEMLAYLLDLLED